MVLLPLIHFVWLSLIHDHVAAGHLRWATLMVNYNLFITILGGAVIIHLAAIISSVDTDCSWKYLAPTLAVQFWYQAHCSDGSCFDCSELVAYLVVVLLQYVCHHVLQYNFVLGPNHARLPSYWLSPQCVWTGCSSWCVSSLYTTVVVAHHWHLFVTFHQFSNNGFAWTCAQEMLYCHVFVASFQLYGIPIVR